MKLRALLFTLLTGILSTNLFAQTAPRDTTKPNTPETAPANPNVIPADTIYNKLRNIPDYRGIKGDSTIIPKSRQSQQTEFMNGAYDYPPKPRNMWEVGITGGTAFIASDVPTQLGWGGGLYVRKALGYVLSLRVEGLYDVEYGLNWKPQTGLEFNSTLNGNDNSALDYYHTTHYVYDNYECQMENLNVDVVIALNNIGWHHAAKDRKFIVNGIFGAAGLLYMTHINQLNAQGQRYNYSEIPNTASKTQIISDLKSLLDNTYETQGDQEAGHAKLFGQWIDPGFDAGFQLQYHISKRFNVGAEFLLTMVHDNALSGDRFQFNNTIARYDNYHHEFLSLGYVIGKRGIEPLYWQNPLDYTYDALKTMKKNLADMLKDSDGDGVPDYLDKEPNTPPGQPVDTHGVALKLDKHGVPHYDMKGNFEPSTLIETDLDTIKQQIKDLQTQMNDVDSKTTWFLPMIFFDLDRDNVKAEYYPELKYIATVMKSHPKLKVIVYGYTDVRASEKYNLTLSQKRAENAKDYLVKTYGIDPDRLIVKYAGKDDPLVPGLKPVYPYKENEQQVNRRVEFKIFDPKTDQQ